ncbi:hypothetical protein [Bradyrhizobium ottawaense]|uniref:Uncharacterized protein n=1 Tax=Bradyrhizobium ottawaense TaxID=931866 RepID=A0ABY0QH36_9BRAD|nr:hypothetical protein [Bradyrhizobium ottawaense]SDK40051.1 hypothetical protein SAMN05444163_8024 [Bradyrhizobium ottawaense]
MESIISWRPPLVLRDDFIVATNEDWTREWQLQTENEAPILIEAGWKFFMQLQKQSSGDLVMTNSNDNQRLMVLDHEAGKYGLRVRQADAAQIPAGQYDYDIVLVAGDGIYRLVKGSIQVDQGITNVPGQEKWSHFPLILRP